MTAVEARKSGSGRARSKLRSRSAERGRRSSFCTVRGGCAETATFSNASRRLIGPMRRVIPGPVREIPMRSISSTIGGTSSSITAGKLYDRLGLDALTLVGHSFGGMLACEIAAVTPGRTDKLVLIDPLGLWRDDLPVKNWMILPEDQRRGALFADPAGAAAERFFELPADAAARIEAQADFIWSQACTGKFVWPIPDKGLKKARSTELRRRP